MTSSPPSEPSRTWAPPTGPIHPDLPIGTAADPGSATHGAAESIPSGDEAAGSPAGGSGGPSSSLHVAGDTSETVADGSRTRSSFKVPLVVLGGLVLIALLLFLADWTARNIEALQLLHQIEKSESAMGDTQTATVAIAKSAPPGTFPLPPDKDLPRDISAQIEKVSANGRDAVAEAGEGVAAVGFLPWHSKLIEAQDSYLDHNLAWVRHLEAGSDEGEVLVRGDDKDIKSTWETAEIRIRAAMPLVPFPGISERVEDIFKEGTDESSGPTVQASGPGVLAPAVREPEESVSPFVE